MELSLELSGSGLNEIEAAVEIHVDMPSKEFRRDI
jgi:hypothetical protein